MKRMREGAVRKGVGGVLIVIAALAGVFVVHAVRASRTTTVTTVINATSIQCADGRTVRLLGLVELAAYPPSVADACRQYLTRLLCGKPIRIVNPHNPRPGMAYVYSGEILVNGRMIRDGYARVDLQDDYPERDLFLAYEKEAKARGLGIWDVHMNHPR